tara:strand:+ start:4583 stop:5662 length:1080 start_codon:yes stop_codon:yes gene_type:complete
MKTLQEQYNLIKEGKGHKGVFLKEAKRLFPNIVPNSATFNQTSKLLKQRSVINENIFPLMPSSGLNPFSTFDKFVNEEAKATEKKTTKEVEEAEITGYDYKDPKNLNNQIFDQYLNGVRVELEKDPKLDLTGAREKVSKNLEKDPLFYMKNAAFGVEGIGYEELKNQEEPKGKHKSSGYGDLKENNMSKSTDLKELLEEAVAGIPSIGNPFLDRKKTNYESKFETFLAEADTDAKRADDAKRLGKKGEENIYGAGVKKGEEVEAAKMKKEEMAPKKEGKMKYSEVVKKAEKLGEMAKNKVMMEVYGKKKRELEETLGTINEDSNLSEFIDEGKKKELHNEIKLYEKAYMTAEADYNTSK